MRDNMNEVKLRLGSISFINSLPVDLGLISGSIPTDAEIITGTPAGLNEKVLKKEIDVSPISALWYAEHAKEFLLFPDLSISSESGVQSVLLFSRAPLKHLKNRPISITSQGRTTPALLEIICRLRYGFRPNIKSARPETRVLMLTSHQAAQAVEAAVLAGASGYLLKNGGREDLLKGIRAVAQGESLLSPSVAAEVLARFAALARKERERENDLLSDREKEVLALVARGLTNRQIAAELVLSENTARNHLSHILDKLGLSRRAQVADYAAQRGLLEPPASGPGQL